MIQRFLSRLAATAKYAIAAALGLGLAAAGAYAWTNRPVEVAVAAIQNDVPVRVFGLGTVEARVATKAGFEVGATLAELNADHGDRVAKGDVLAKLNAGEQEAKVAKARAGLASARVASLKAQANLEKAQAVLAQKQEVNRRRQELAGRNVVSEQSAEEAARDEAVAAADVSVATAEISVAEALIADAGAQLQFEETMLGHRSLRAPFDAIVTERHKEIGSVIKAGDAIFTLVAADAFWGLAYIDEARAGYIEEGQVVEARLRSRPLEKFSGKVVRIGLESDRVNEERRVYVKGDNPPSRVYLGEQVEFWITVANLPKALLVPEAAVRGYDGREGRVWTVESGRLRSRTVRFRHRTEDARIEIADGVPEGAAVVIRPDPRLAEGRRARIAQGDGR
jgi:HlyD family secretion protein